MSPIVLHLTGMRAKKFGGMEHYLSETAKQSADRGLATVIQYEEPPSSQSYIAALKQTGAEILISNLTSPIANSLPKMVRLLSVIRPTIIQTHFLPEKLLPLACLFGRLYRADRCIAMVHSLQPRRYPVRNKLAYLGFDEVLPVSNAITDSLIADGLSSDHVTTNYMGLIDPPAFSEAVRLSLRNELEIPHDSLVFGTIAFDSPLKGMDVLMPAFERFLAKRPDAHLIQLGIDPRISSLAREHRHNSRIHWLGVRDDAASYLSAVDVYVQPSRSEGLPLAILEAMAIHRPVLATHVGGIPEAVSDPESGVLVAPGDPDALVSGMTTIGSTDADHVRIQMGMVGYKRFRRLFDGRASVRRLVDRYTTHSKSDTDSNQGG